MTDNRFAIDYAKLGTSTCKKCKSKIGKGEIRIAKITASPFSEGDTMKVYHHVPCMFDTFLHARATTKIIDSSTDLDVYANISQADRQSILDQIKRIETARTSKSPKKKLTKSNEKTLPNVSINVDKSIVDTNNLEKKSVLSTENTDKDSASTTTVHLSISNDSKHPDNSFRQFRGLCTKIAETNGHLAKTALVEDFITYGNDGESYKGESNHVSTKLFY
jgi:DNA ligase 3